MKILICITLVLSILALALDVWLLTFIIKGLQRKKEIDKQLDKLTMDITKQIMRDNYLREVEETKFNKEENNKDGESN